MLFDQQLSAQCQEISKRSWSLEVYLGYVKHVVGNWEVIWQELLQLEYLTAAWTTPFEASNPGC